MLRIVLMTIAAVVTHRGISAKGAATIKAFTGNGEE